MIDALRAIRGRFDTPSGTSLAEYLCVRGIRWLGGAVGGRADRPTDSVTIEDRTISVADSTVEFRIYEPTAGTPPRPATVFLHGGGWISGGPGTNQRLCSLLAEERGRTVVAVAYRLAPEHRHPRPLRDCERVLEWIATDGPANGIDPDAVRLFGTSAGGTIAAGLHADPSVSLPLSIAQQTLVYPPLDPRFDERRENGRLLRRVSRPAIGWLWSLYLDPDSDRSDPRVAPLRSSAFGAVPPTTVVTCGFDPLRQEGREYAQRLAAHGVPVGHVEFPRLPHGFLTFLPWISPRRTRTILQRIHAATPDVSE
jgi:acetyl esterase